MTKQQTAFIREVLDDARVAASELHIPVSVVLAQWIDETGAGTSPVWLEGHNYAGVSGNADGQEKRFDAVPFRGTALLAYPDRARGLAGYVYRWHNPVYESTRNAWAVDPSPQSVAKAIEASPWAAGHYHFTDLQNLITSLRLTQYDDGSPVTPPPPPNGGPCSALPPGPPPAGYRLLRVGVHGADVAQLQIELRNQGIVAVNSFGRNGKADGIFGPGTAAAVVAFQERHGLHADGIVGRQTWCALGVR